MTRPGSASVAASRHAQRGEGTRAVQRCVHNVAVAQMHSIQERISQQFQETWAHADEGGFHLPLMSPQISSVRLFSSWALMLQDAGGTSHWVQLRGAGAPSQRQRTRVRAARTHAQVRSAQERVPVPSATTPAARLVREKEERGWVHAPPSTPAVQQVRHQEEQAWAQHGVSSSANAAKVTGSQSGTQSPDSSTLRSHDVRRASPRRPLPLLLALRWPWSGRCRRTSSQESTTSLPSPSQRQQQQATSPQRLRQAAPLPPPRPRPLPTPQRRQRRRRRRRRSPPRPQCARRASCTAPCCH